MKHYKIVYPDEHGNVIEDVVSEKDIIEDYFDTWAHNMVMVGKTHLVSYTKCIEDWVTINWAEEII